MKEKSYSISQIAQLCGLSRSTLLYYERIGLIDETPRKENGYRSYSSKELQTVRRVQAYRQMGLPLKKIKSLMDQHGEKGPEILEDQLFQLGSQIQELKRQQFQILSLLQNRELHNKYGVLTARDFEDILKAAGMNEEMRRQWHREFEARSPETHRQFLLSLGLRDFEIEAIIETISKL